MEEGKFCFNYSTFKKPPLGQRTTGLIGSIIVHIGKASQGNEQIKEMKPEEKQKLREEIQRQIEILRNEHPGEIIEIFKITKDTERWQRVDNLE